ncbi:MAG: hypothetical protein K0R18_147 [Bacillales bacterium]|jgi:hypothetical protein|nr:hypothetical protein [Bacillales bacterium]
MNEDICLIPRNLRKADTIIQTPIKLTMKQLVYIGIGIGGAYFAYGAALPLLYKGLIMGGSALAGVAGGLFKYQGSSIDELVGDSVVYVQRKSYYNKLNKRSEVVVNINSRKEETTIIGARSISFTV